MVKVLVDTQPIGMDMSIVNSAYIVISKFLETEQGQWVRERNANITYTFDQDYANMGFMLSLYADMTNDEEIAEYTLRFK